MDLWLGLRLAAFLGALIGVTPLARRYRLRRVGAPQRNHPTGSDRTRWFVLVVAIAAGIGTALLGFHR